MKTDNENFIEYLKNNRITEFNVGDHKESKYFKHVDFYNMESGDGLTILPKFKTYQQTTDYSCGAACVKMVLEHYGVEADELELAEKLNITRKGITTRSIVNFFKNEMKWDVQSSLDEPHFTNQYTFKKYEDFKKWVIQSLKDDKTPILVEWSQWQGHWSVVVGFDDYNSPQGDILILADPFNVSDHCQNGYQAVGASMFYYSWRDVDLFPEKERCQPWCRIRPSI